MRKSYKVLILSIAAVIIAAVAIVIPNILSRNDSKIEDNINNNHVSDEDSQRIIIEPPAGHTSEGCETPKSSEVIVYDILKDEIVNYGYDDTYFHVSIFFYFYTVEDMFKFEGKTIDEYIHDPVLKLYREEYDQWYETIYIPMDEEMTAAEERGEEHALGWWKHSEGELFNEYWYETQPEDVIVKYEEANAKLDEAMDAYNLWATDDRDEIELSMVKAECERLCELGLDVEFGSEAYLTRRQIEEFPATQGFGYIIDFAPDR